MATIPILMIWAASDYDEILYLARAWDEESAIENDSGWLEVLKKARADHKGHNVRVVRAQIDIDPVLNALGMETHTDSETPKPKADISTTMLIHMIWVRDEDWDNLWLEEAMDDESIAAGGDWEGLVAKARSTYGSENIAVASTHINMGAVTRAFSIADATTYAPTEIHTEE